MVRERADMSHFSNVFFSVFSGENAIVPIRKMQPGELQVRKTIF